MYTIRTRYVCDIVREVGTPPPGPLQEELVGDGLTVQKLQTELSKQKQLAEELKSEIFQQEQEKRRLLHVARSAKESEAVALRAAYERRGYSQSSPSQARGEGVTGMNLWKVPPPRSKDHVRDDRGGSLPCMRIDERRSDEARWGGQNPISRRRRGYSRSEGDHLRLAGLRRPDQYSVRRGPGATELGQDYESRFRTSGRGDRACYGTPDSYPRSSGSSHGTGGCGDGSSARPYVDHRGIISGRIQTKSSYILPDGSIHRDSGARNGPEPREAFSGTYRPEEDESIYADTIPESLGHTPARDSGVLPSARVLRTLDGDVCGGRTPDHDDSDGVHGRSCRRRRRLQETRSIDPRALGGFPVKRSPVIGQTLRPPRPLVPFLNLPPSGEEGNRRLHPRQGISRESLPHVNGGCASGRPRGTLLARLGERPVSDCRSTLAGSPRFDEDTMESPSSPASGVEEGARNQETSPRRGGRRRRRRRWRDGIIQGGQIEHFSDGDGSVGSGTTDIEYLRHCAEAKLRALERREAAEAVRDEIDALLQPSRSQETRSTTRRSGEGKGRERDSLAKLRRRSHRTAEGCSTSYHGESRERRPGSQRSECSIFGDSRWATLNAS